MWISLVAHIHSSIPRCIQTPWLLTKRQTQTFNRWDDDVEPKMYINNNNKLKRIEGKNSTKFIPQTIFLEFESLFKFYLIRINFLLKIGQKL